MLDSVVKVGKESIKRKNKMFNYINNDLEILTQKMMMMMMMMMMIMMMMMSFIVNLIVNLIVILTVILIIKDFY